MNPVGAKEIPMNRTCTMFLSSIVILLSVFNGCTSIGENYRKLKPESDRLFIPPPGVAGPGWTGHTRENCHVIKASACSKSPGVGPLWEPLLSPLMSVNESSDSIGLIFDLSSLPENRRVRQAILGLYRIEPPAPDNLNFKFVKTQHPEYFFDHMVLGNVNSAYGYVKALMTANDYRSSFVIKEARVQDEEENILPTLVCKNAELSDRDHIRLAESTRKSPVWHTGEPLNEGGILGYSRRIYYGDLIYYFMEDKTTEATHEGNWDLFDVTMGVRRDYRGDKKLLLVLMQYPNVVEKDALSQIPLAGNARSAFFKIYWASLKNSPEVAPQIFVEFETDASPLRPEQDEPKSTGSKSLLKEQLKKLEELFNEGIITKEEYERRRQSTIDKLLD